MTAADTNSGDEFLVAISAKTSSKVYTRDVIRKSDLAEPGNQASFIHVSGDLLW